MVYLFIAENKYAFAVGIVGHRGYSGAELVRLLGGHPSLEPVLLEHREEKDSGPRFLRANACAERLRMPILCGPRIWLR